MEVSSWTHLRFANPSQLRLNKYGNGPFLRLRTSPLPEVPGVYAVLGEDEKVLYIGRTHFQLVGGEAATP